MAATRTRPAALLQLALDPGVSPPGDATSQRILDGALELWAASGLGSLTMDDVARRAGVGRMTVYRRFGEKQTLVQALAVREMRTGLAEVAAALDFQAPVAERVADGFVAALQIARRHPVLLRFSRFEPEVLLDGLRDPDAPIVATLRGFLAALIREGQEAGEMRESDPDAAAELLVRIGLSFVLMPDSVIEYEDEDAARELARTLIAPIVST